MKVKAFKGHELFHEGTLAFADVEANGFRIDLERLDRNTQFIVDETARLKKELESDKVWKKEWLPAFGAKAKLSSDHQLAHVLYDRLGYDCPDLTKKGKKRKVDQRTLEGFDLPFIDKLQRYNRLSKAKTTNLDGIRRELVGEYLYPSFRLDTVESYRSSSREPNCHNFPAREEETAELIRSIFICRDEHEWNEADFKTLEVCINGCYTKDPRLIRYVTDPKKDMHKDTAMKLYLLQAGQVTDAIRHDAKNKFVFAEFYGDYYKQCARSLWKSMAINNLTLADGTPLRVHLAKQGVKRLGKCADGEEPVPGTYEHLVQQAEWYLWDVMFPATKKWRKEWFQKYLKLGYFDTLTGFRLHGEYRRNQVICDPVQGSAFHCLLWTLIHLNKWLRHYKMRSKIIGQIHDSIQIDAHRDEAADVRATLHELVSVHLPRAWPWIIVPLRITVEASTTNWYEKEKVAA